MIPPQRPSARRLEEIKGRLYITIHDANRAINELFTEIDALTAEVEDAYDRGILKGSEIGDSTAKRALEERDNDMRRMQDERISFVKDRDHWHERHMKLKSLLKVISELVVEPGPKAHYAILNYYTQMVLQSQITLIEDAKFEEKRKD